MRETFAVGRTGGRRKTVVWLRRRREPPFPGPWKVRAVVSSADRPGALAPSAVAPPRERHRGGRAPGGQAEPPVPSRTVDDDGRGQLELFAG